MEKRTRKKEKREREELKEMVDMKRKILRLRHKEERETVRQRENERDCMIKVETKKGAE